MQLVPVGLIGFGPESFYGKAERFLNSRKSERREFRYVLPPLPKSAIVRRPCELYFAISSLYFYVIH